MHFIFFVYILCVCVCMFLFLSWLNYFFFTFSLCLCSSSFTILFEHIVLFFQVIEVLSIINPSALPFQKVCGNCHVTNVTISPMGGVYYNACSKSTVQKLNFLHGSIATNDELVLLTIEGKWLEVIVYMTKSEFLDLPHPKQIQLLISIRIHDKFRLLTTFAIVGF